MKVNQYSVKSNFEPDSGKAILLFGKDLGAVEEAGRLIVSQYPGESLLSTGFELKKGEFNLHMQLREQGLFNPIRIIRIMDVKDNCTDLIKEALESYDGTCNIVLEGGDLPKAGSLRKMFENEKAKNLLCCGYYSPSNKKAWFTKALSERGMHATPKALAMLEEWSSENSQINKNTADKLALAFPKTRELGEFDIKAITENDSFANLWYLRDLLNNPSFSINIETEEKITSLEKQIELCMDNFTPIGLLRFLSRQIKNSSLDEKVKENILGLFLTTEALSKNPLHDPELLCKGAIFHALKTKLVGNDHFSKQVRW